MSAPTTEAARNDREEEEPTCSICLDVLKEPIVEIPSCKHRFCSSCLEGWRSKYDTLSGRRCPQCRGKLPVTKQMITQLKMNKEFRSLLKGHIDDPGYIFPRPGTEAAERFSYSNLSEEDIVPILMLSHSEQQHVLRGLVEKEVEVIGETIVQLEEQIEDNDVLEDTTEEEYEAVPYEIRKAAEGNDVETVLRWLGPPPVPKKRLNAKIVDKYDRTLLHEAEFENSIGLMRILLQYGAEVDPLSATGQTPFKQACHFDRLDEAARLLLEWGASKEEPNSMDPPLHEIARIHGRNPKLAALLKTPLGGRRCEIVGMEGEKGGALNGKTCIVGSYSAKREKYAVTMERTMTEEREGKSEVRGMVKPENLRRRDRTPTDPGPTYVVFKGSTPDGNNIFDVGEVVQSEDIET